MSAFVYKEIKEKLRFSNKKRQNCSKKWQTFDSNFKSAQGAYYAEYGNCLYIIANKWPCLFITIKSRPRGGCALRSPSSEQIWEEGGETPQREGKN